MRHFLLVAMPTREEVETDVALAVDAAASNVLQRLTLLFEPSLTDEQLERLGTVLDEEFRNLTQDLEQAIFIMRSPIPSPPSAVSSSSTGGTEADESEEGVVLPLARERSRSPRRR